MYRHIVVFQKCGWTAHTKTRTIAGLSRYTTRSSESKGPKPTPSRLVLRQGRVESSIWPSTHTTNTPLITHTPSKPPVPASRPAPVDRIRHSLTSLSHAFLPTDYKTSVTPEYISYTKWQFLHNVLGSASGVLSTQVMLYAMGLNSGALPLSAAINWVIKDGFGQFGGVIYATMVGQKFDSDPKHQRFWSSVWLQTATWLEMLTPLFPHLFVVIGSVANVGKNIAWLAMSATRASINKTFCRKENLGDVTAKSGSQSTAAGLIGTALGIVVGGTMDVSVYTLILGFVPISLASLWGNYKSLLYTVTPTLNVERARLMLQDAILVQNGALVFSPEHVRTPRQVSKIEKFMREIRGIEPEDRMPGIIISANISKLEHVFPWTNSNAAANVAHMVRDAFQPQYAWNELYYIGLHTTDRLYLWYDDRASDADVLLGVYHAMAYRKLLGARSPSDARIESYVFAKQTFASACQHIMESGWDTSIMYFSKRSRFVNVAKPE
ncbi:hypothetical protein IWW49_002832 [Coemansia sp. RSA 1797]|nr:hypothetical protein IWW49_002832 [Coemansia sp. RSA 1797]